MEVQKFGGNSDGDAVQIAEYLIENDPDYKK